MSLVKFPVLYIPDPTKDRPLFYGQVYVGTPGLDPEITANQVPLYIVQEDGTNVTAPQPFILSAGGVPTYNGSPVRLYVEETSYSLKILSNQGEQVYYFHAVTSEEGIVTARQLQFANVTEMTAAFVDTLIGDIVSSGATKWERVQLTGYADINDYVPLTDVYVEDFNDGSLSQSVYVSIANDYCQQDNIRAKLVFQDDKDYLFDANTSFDIFVEGGGWYCAGVAKLDWDGDPSASYAINILGRYYYNDSNSTYSRRLMDSNFCVMEGFTIGTNGDMKEGSGLRIGRSDGRTDSTNMVVTSKFIVKRVTILDFDDCLDLWNGSWAFRLDHVNTIGGSIRTPDNYFTGLDYGENIEFHHCFIADNHTRTDGEMGTVGLGTGEYIFIGGSFDNMLVSITSDANVKMTNPHFENPTSTDKNKRFLEVLGTSSSCVLDNPTIVIRDTDIYSTLFYCVAGSDTERLAWSGGLTLANPQFQAVNGYRPDLSFVKSAEDATTYDGYGFRELVGGGGRVKLSGQAFINSLYFTYKPIVIARNLVGASLDNTSFDLNIDGEQPSFWSVESAAPYAATAAASNDFSWVGDVSLKSTVDYNGGATFNSFQAYQDIDCAGGNLALANLKVKWVIELTNGATGEITGEVSASIDFHDKDGAFISTGWFDRYDIVNTNSATYDGWENLDLTAHAPEGAKTARLKLTAFSTSDSADKKIHTYWDGIAMNVF